MLSKYCFSIKICFIGDKRLKTPAFVFAVNNPIGTISSLAN